MFTSIKVSLECLSSYLFIDLFIRLGFPDYCQRAASRLLEAARRQSAAF